MRAVQQADVRALGKRRRHVTELYQPVQAEIADSRELPLFEPRPDGHLGEDLECPRRKAFEPGHGQQRRIRPNLGIELGADPGERIVQRQRVEIAAPFVEQITGDGGEAVPIGRIGRRSDRHEEHRADHRHFAVLDRPRAQTVPERLTTYVGK